MTINCNKARLARYSLHPEAGSPHIKAFGTRVAEAFSLPAPLGEILYQRGVTNLSEVKEFLYPQLAELPSPQSMKGMQAAATCIVDAIRQHSTIFIHGDYDVDGISATALLASFFKEIGGGKTFQYIPNRLKEEYGMSTGSVHRLLAQAEDVTGGVLISADCGISSFEGVEFAKRRGLTVVITDHHEPKERLPDADVILNPKQHDCGFPFRELSGVGVAFYLIYGIRKALIDNGLISEKHAPNLKKYLDFVALGTVADVVPLIGLNRILVKAGLEVLNTKSRPGIYQLCQMCSLEKKELLAEDIAFKLAPRINATGRLGEPQLGFELLCTEDEIKAQELATTVEQFNSQRRQHEADALEKISLQAERLVEEKCSGLSLYQEKCHPGVLGILAARITERNQMPAIIFTDDTTENNEEYLKGSGRSDGSVNLLSMLDQCADSIVRYGGHRMAVGVTIKKSFFEEFRAKFNHAVQSGRGIGWKGRRVDIDYVISDKTVMTKQFAEALQLLQPFGAGNPEPKFLLPNEKIIQCRTIKSHHLAFKVHIKGNLYSGIGFYLAKNIQKLERPVDLIFHLKRPLHTQQGCSQIQAVEFISL